MINLICLFVLRVMAAPSLNKRTVLSVASNPIFKIFHEHELSERSYKFVNLLSESHCHGNVTNYDQHSNVFNYPYNYVPHMHPCCNMV